MFRLFMSQVGQVKSCRGFQYHHCLVKFVAIPPATSLSATALIVSWSPRLPRMHEFAVAKAINVGRHQTYEVAFIGLYPTQKARGTMI